MVSIWATSDELGDIEMYDNGQETGPSSLLGYHLVIPNILIWERY